MKFKYLMLLMLVTILMVACNKQENVQWEYMIISISENLTLQEQSERLAKTMTGAVGYDGMFSINFEDPTSKLNELGKQGWELVDTYTTTETVFPNMGNAGYHTGVKSNTRTQTINFVFKRAVKESDAKDNASSQGNKPSQNEVVIVDEEVEDFVDTTSN